MLDIEQTVAVIEAVKKDPTSEIVIGVLIIVVSSIVLGLIGKKMSN